MPRDDSGETSIDAEGRLRWGRRAAGVLIQRLDNKQILLLLRSQDVLDPGFWGIPGGRVEPDEDPLEGALREVEEELGDLPHIQIIGEKSITSGDFTYTTFFAVMPGSIAEVWEPTLNWENDEWKWVSLKRLQRTPILG